MVTFQYNFCWHQALTGWIQRQWWMFDAQVVLFQVLRTSILLLRIIDLEDFLQLFTHHWVCPALRALADVILNSRVVILGPTSTHWVLQILILEADWLSEGPLLDMRLVWWQRTRILRIDWTWLFDGWLLPLLAWRSLTLGVNISRFRQLSLDAVEVVLWKDDCLQKLTMGLTYILM